MEGMFSGEFPTSSSLITIKFYKNNQRVNEMFSGPILKEQKKLQTFTISAIN